jgi:hypothetical protein
MDPSKLRKAAGSFQVIWASISSGSLAVEDETVAQALRRLGDALERCGKPVQHLLERHGMPMAAALPPAPSAESSPPRRLQATEITRAFTFADRAAAWLSQHDDTQVSEDDLKNLQLMARLNFETRKIIGAVLAPQRADDRTPPGAPGQHVAAGPAVVSSESPSHTESPLYSGELVLLDAPEDPLLQEWGDKMEVTPRATELVDRFLADAGLKLDASARQKLNRNVEKWLVATPEGMALVIRIGELQGQPEPYPKYVPESAVGDGESD